MIKSLTALCLCFMVSVLMSAQDAVSVRMTVPSIVEAGQEFLVSIAVDKGNLEEFSRFQQELPAGLTAAQENSGTADYSFDNQRVRFIWLKLPAEPSINLTYRVKVNERLKGTFTIGGEFSYVEANDRKSVNLNSEVVNITPSPNVQAENQIDIASFSTVMAAESVARSSDIEVTCIRQTPYMSRTGNDILVNLLVFKKDMNKFAKIEETIPEGFEVRSMESREGMFTFKDGIAKFVWMNLPGVSGFTVSYRLIPTATQTMEGLHIDGKLSYILEGKTIDVQIVQKDIDLSGVTDQNVEEIVAAINRGEALPTDKPVAITEEITPTPPVIDEPPPPPARESSTTARTGSSSRIPATQLLAVQDGLYFRVQLAATRRFRDVNISYREYNLSRPVKVESHEGWYKYTAGSFSSYKQAGDFKNGMESKGITGAFVVAYRNGARVDIIDALPLGGGQ
jgi:hypothetical protein